MNWLADGFGRAAMAVRAAVQPIDVRPGPGPPAGGRLCRHRLAAGRPAADRGAAGWSSGRCSAGARWSRDRPHAIRTDVLYTLIHRLGLFRVGLFFWCSRSSTRRSAPARARHRRLAPRQVWPGVTDLPWLSFALYLLVFDFADYWMHRGQHAFRWWWSLHSLHHSQRQMTMWSDNRNHLLDDLLRDSMLVLLAQVIGVARASSSPSSPSRSCRKPAACQPAAVVRPHRRAPVDQPALPPPAPRHRHRPREPWQGIAGRPQLRRAAAWWDMLFRTANFELRYDATGIRDQVEKGRDYGRGFWAQQWLGLKRLAGQGLTAWACCSIRSGARWPTACTRASSPCRCCRCS
jgi:hypothetical protein